MTTKQLQRICYSVAALSLTAFTACVDGPTASSPVSDAVSLATDGSGISQVPVGATATVCKEGNGPATNFTFAVSVNGGPVTNHTIALGSCVAVHTVPTNVPNFATVSVTELTPPANWALTGIAITSTTPNPAHYQPVINSPNASARISHDFGTLFTFTNTFTPPPPPPPPGPSCTLTQGYWKNHGEDWDQVSDGKPFLTTSTFYNSGVSYLTILTTPPKGGNAYLQLAHQFIAASLNVNGAPSGVGAVDAALAGAAAYFASAPAGIPSPTGATRTQLQAWATTLDNFNNGVTGPGHCPE